MTPAEHVEQIKARAQLSTRRIGAASRLRHIDDLLTKEIALNSLLPWSSDNYEIFRALDSARAHVKSLLVRLATNSVFRDD
jgi:hypothetical protein